MRHAATLAASLLALALAPLANAQDTVVHLWDKGQPGFESRRDIPEQHAEWWWRSINNPSLTVFAPPAGKNSGTAIIVVPGGGHQNVVFGEEGMKPAQYLQSLGVTAFALKYVLAREDGSPYSIEGDAELDLRRAIRYVRAHAKEYGITRIGIMGFSAGGELTDMAAFNPQDGIPGATDPVDQMSARPDFLIDIYPGPLGIPVSLNQAPPPAFMLNAHDDRMAMTDTDAISRLYDAYPTVPMERHILSGGQHGFNMGDRSKLKAVQDWRNRLGDWLGDQGYLSH